MVDQTGFIASVGVWGNSYLEGNLDYFCRHSDGNDRPAGRSNVQPLNGHAAFMAKVGLNESLLAVKDSGRVAFGLQVGNYIHPKEYAQTKTRSRWMFRARVMNCYAARRQHGPSAMPVRIRQG